MIGLWSYTNFRLRNKECEVLLGGIVFYFIFINVGYKLVVFNKYVEFM